jgi:hypothetical protein
MTTDRTVEKFELYIISLWFLFVLMTLITANIPVCHGNGCRFIGFTTLAKMNIVPIAAIALIALGVLYFLRFDYKLAGSKSIPVKISSVEDINYEHLTFLTTYIIPLICFNLTSVRYVVSLGFLLIIIGVIYVKTDKFYANPTLAILGFRLFSAAIRRRTGEEVRVVLITKGRLHDGDEIQFLELDSRVYFARVKA